MPNPHIELTRAELYRAANDRAGELLASDADTGHLLLAMAMQLHHAQAATRGPGGTLKGQTLQETYGPRLTLLMREARYEVLRDAADAVLGQGAQRWITPGRYEGSPYQRATESNAGLAEVLAELEATRK